MRTLAWRVKKKLPRRVERPGESAPGGKRKQKRSPSSFSSQDQRVEVKAEQGRGNHFGDELFRKWRKSDASAGKVSSGGLHSVERFLRKTGRIAWTGLDEKVGAEWR